MGVQSETPFTVTTPCTNMAPGTYTISVTLFQDNSYYNAAGFNINGTVNTPGRPALVKETPGCSTFAAEYCPEPNITGSAYVCSGGTTTLSDLYAGGTWSSSNTSIASVNEFTGVVTGGDPGLATITYTDPCGRTISKTVTVIAQPTIDTPIVVCSGSYIILNATPTTDGYWTSRIPTIGWINAGSDTLYGETAGHDSLTYTYTNVITCSRTVVATVNPLPYAGRITGPNPICLGSSNAFSDTVAGGTWRSVNTTIASVDIAGSVYGRELGTDTIIYTVTGPAPTFCQNRDSFVVTVITLPAHPTISLSSPVVYENCLDTLTGSPGLGGYITSVSWGYSIPSYLSGSSSTPTLIVTGSPTTTGTTTVYYTVTNICGSTPDSITVHVIPRPPITGPKVVCVRSIIDLSDTLAGGTWSSSNTSASITSGPIGGGIATGVSGGIDTITYTTYCGSVTTTITINPLPDLITGDTFICYTYSATLFDATTGGVWSSSNTSIATINATGFYTGVGVGRDTISYTLISTGCAQTTVVTVNPLPAIITPPSEMLAFTYIMCAGSVAYLTDSTTGGTWTSSDSAVVTIDSMLGFNLVISGVSAGTAIITYTLPTGCYVTSTTITVNPLPATITGVAAVCVGSTTVLSDASTGGTWAIFSAPAATIDVGTGVVTGITAGTSLVTYTLPTGCTINRVVTVNPLPGPFTASGSMCVGATASLSDAGAGTWSSSYTSIATVVTATGIVTGVSPGIDSITYTLPTGCTVTGAITVDPFPAPITGIDSVCPHAMITLSDASTGGTWSSSNSAIARAYYASGIVLGVTPGLDTIIYTLPTGCTAEMTVTVDGLPTIPPITGTDSICISESTTLYDVDLPGVWSSPSSLVTVANVLGAGVVSGGPSPGVVPVFYTVTNNCGSSSITDTVYIIAPVPPIFGSTGVCSGYKDTLSTTVAGGVWSSSNSGVATVSANGIVTGVSSGTDTITYSGISACGAYTTTKQIIVNEALFISTNFSVACQTLTSGISDRGRGHPLITTGGNCIILCDSSVIRYYANGNGGRYTWVVTGGIVLANYNDSIDIMWPTPGIPGSIYLYDTIGHCNAETNICIQVIQRPNAFFFPSTPTTCLGDNIIFTDLSTASPLSPIVSTIWFFGDGSATSETDPSHVYTSPGYYTVMLVVRNACNCTDTITEGITITQDTGPNIICPSIACQGDTVTYSTSAVCSYFNWTVTGGTIVSGAGTASIGVVWDGVGADGYGTVSLANPCGVCTYPTTVKIPVILQNPIISGPDTVCTGEQYAYSLPLWPATQYLWDAGTPSPIVGYGDDHTVVLEFNQPGYAALQGWYQNTLKLCGGDVFKNITVWPSTSIVGNTAMCDSGTFTYTLSDIYILSANWTLSNAYTNAVMATGTGASFTYSFTRPGSYVLNATGALCSEPIGITVQTPPPALTALIGPDTVCLNVPYTYVASSPATGVTYNWQITGGTITPATGSDTVTVVWTATSGMQLTASLANISVPYCPGPATVENIVWDLPRPNIMGNLSPCANGIDTFSAGYLRGDTYDWIITPNIAGSIIYGAGTPYIIVQWNNYSGAAALQVTTQKCDITGTGSVPIDVVMPPALTISAPSPVCPHTPVSFTATSGATNYYWIWGDGSETSTHTNTTSHTFPENITTSNIIRHVTVTASSTGGSCPIWGIATFDETELPGPVAYLSTGDNTTLCPADPTALFVATVTHNVGGLTYEWLTDPAAPPGSTNSTYTYTGFTVTTPFYGGVYYIVTASNGCKDTSNWIRVTIDPSCGGSSVLGGPIDSSGGGGGHCGFYVSASSPCSQVALTAAAAGGDIGQWTAEILPASGPLPFVGSNDTATYTEPGIYRFEYKGTYSGGIYTGTTGCYIDTTIVDTMNIVANFRWQLKCAPGLTDSVFLQDYTAYLPWCAIDSIVWDTSGVRVNTGANLTLVAPGSRLFTVTEIVYSTTPEGPDTCTVTQTINLPNLDAAFTDSLSPICEGLPITFTPADTAGVVNFNWNFGDNSANLLPFTKRTYTWRGPAELELFPVTLTVTNSIGCVDSFSQNVAIQENLLGGSIGNNQTVCSKERPVVLSYHPGSGTIPIKYLWNTGDTTAIDSIYLSGYYYVTVTDAYQCVKTIPTYPSLPVKIKVIYTPAAQIYGGNNFCVSQGVTLSTSYDSTVGYQWYRGTTLVGTTNVLSDVGVTAGNSYTYWLVINVLDTASGTYCSDTSALDTVRVYASPPMPVVNGPIVVSCIGYQLQLTAVDSSAGYYNWSDGTFGPVDNIFSGGPLNVVFTDMNGCQATSYTGYVPIAPSNYAPYFPSGCYTLCQQQLPLTMYGPPDVIFNYWAWLYNSDTASQGYASLMAPCNIDSSGSYEWNFSNGLCGITTDTMDISVKQCNACLQTNLTASILCTPETSARYNIYISFNSPGACSYTLGTSIGPIDPFSGSLPAAGSYSFRLTYTTMTLPPPDSVEVEIIFTLDDGSKCFAEVKVAVPPCMWPGLRLASPDDTATTNGNGNHLQPTMNTSMLVFPNPAWAQVTVSYNYGTWVDGSQHDLTVFDEMGRKIATIIPQGAEGNWSLNTNDWSPGIYIIRMEGNGTAVQTQRLVVAGK